MALKLVTYNIQYGFGLDGRYDLDRIIDAVRDADIIALQEVTRGWLKNGGVDMVAAIENALPDRFCAFGPGADADMMSGMVNGKAVNRRFQFGNMVASRWPIAALRTLLLPRRLRENRLNLQRSALEAVLLTPDGPLRLYSVHLDHLDGAERLEQVAFLKQAAFEMPARGGTVTGTGEFGYPEPPRPEDFIACGDFNFEPGDADYRAMLETGGALVDVTAADPAFSCTDTITTPPTLKRLDHVFATPGLAARCHSPRVDAAAQGSDHQPVWVGITV